MSKENVEKLESLTGTASKKLSADLSSFLKEVKEFSRTVGEPCPEGHRLDAGSGACLPIQGTDHTAFTRSVNDEQGPEWRGEVEKTNDTFDSQDKMKAGHEVALDADEMDEPQSCAEGTTFSFIQRRCVSAEEAEAENTDEYAIEEEDAAGPGQGGHQEIVMMQPEGRRDTVNHSCPPSQFFDYILRECIPLNKDTVMASESIDEEFKKEVASGFARLALTSPDPMDGHRHVATLDESGNGVTSVGGYMHPHSHQVKGFNIVPKTGEMASGEEYTSQHPGVAVPVEMHLEKTEDSESKEEAAPITTKQRDVLPDSVFGVPGKRKFPLDTCGRVRNAMARFNQAKGLSSGEKASLRRKILARAKACGIEVRNFGKANTEEEFAAVMRELMEQITPVKNRMEEYTSQKGEEARQGPCPPGMIWDTKMKKCTKAAAFVQQVKANHSEVVGKQPEGRRDTVGFQCPPGEFFDFTRRRCLSLNPAQKDGTSTSQANEEDAQSRDLAPSPKGKPARLPQDCPPNTIWDKDEQKCTPLDSRKKTKSEEEAQTTPNGPGKKGGPSCPEGQFMNPITKKCMPRKGAFKGKSDSEAAENAEPGNRGGLVDAPAGKVRHPSDCPAGTAWDGVLHVCKELDSMEKVSPGNEQIDPKMHSSVENMSVAKLIQHLDRIIDSTGNKEKSRLAAKDLPNAAFPPSVVSPTRRVLMHHSPGVEDPYDHASVDISRLRNALARVSVVNGFSDKAVEDARDHLLFHAREIVKEDLAKKE